MSDFINTIDALGDEAVMDSIIDRTITEFKDDIITEVGAGAFYECKSMTDVDLPNVTVINSSAFTYASIASSLNLPKLTALKGGNTFQHAILPEIVRLPSFTTGSAWDLSYTSGMKHLDLPIATNVPNRFCCNCGSLETVNLPKVEIVNPLAFGDYSGPGGNALKIIDLPVCTSIADQVFVKATLLEAVILRASTVCTLSNVNSFTGTPIASGTGYIYVPNALIEDYKVATNWSTYATQFRALEDYTVDGTVDGKFVFVGVVIDPPVAMISNRQTVARIGDAYEATLTPALGDTIETTIIMDGVDVTADVYNPETCEISIPTVTGDIRVKTRSTTGVIIYLTPYSGEETGELPQHEIAVTAGMVLELTYYLTKKQGYLYSGSGCGNSYSANAMNVETTTTINITSDGYVSFSVHKDRVTFNGRLAGTAADRLYGNYLIVKILEA